MASEGRDHSSYPCKVILTVAIYYKCQVYNSDVEKCKCSGKLSFKNRWVVRPRIDEAVHLEFVSI